MSTRYLFLLSIFFLTLSCSKDEIRDLEDDLAFEKMKTSLYSMEKSEILVETIEENSVTRRIVLTFEDGESIEVPHSFVKTYEHDRQDWAAKFVLADSTQIELPAIGDLNITPDLIKLDPFGRAPLSAIAKITMPVKGKFSVAVVGKPQGVTIQNSFDAFGLFHELPILGLYQDYENEVQFTFLSKTGDIRATQSVTLKTEKLPNPPTVQINVNNLSNEYHGLYFPAQGRIGFDQRGEIRWYYSGDAQYLLTQLSNGNLVISSALNLVQYHSPAFYEVRMTGEIVRKFNVPNHLHHDVSELPNGNFLVVSNSAPIVYNNGVPEEDFILEMDRQTGAVIKTWDFNTILDPLRKPLPTTRADDWLHINAAYFDPNDNSIVISGRSQSVIAKVDYATGALKWILSSHAEWKTQHHAFLLTPVNDSGQPVDPTQTDFWPYGQHSPKLLPNGNVLVYDNGDYRGFYEKPDATAASYTRGTEYKIDPVTKTVRIAWEYNANKMLYTQFTGSISFFEDSGNRVIGLPPRIIEISQNQSVLFDATIGVSSMYRGFRFDVYASYRP